MTLLLKKLNKAKALLGLAMVTVVLFLFIQHLFSNRCEVFVLAKIA